MKPRPANLKKSIETMKIQSITEAFSMQPASYVVGSNYGYPDIVIIDRIVEEDVRIEGDPFAYYIGYDANNNRLFEFRKGTVSVCYFTVKP